MCFRLLHVFKGRARRAKYWYFRLFCGIISIILMIIENTFMNTTYSDGGILHMMFKVGILVPSKVVGVRRMHDVNRSGWYVLILIYSFILSVTEGDYVDNRYGSNSKKCKDVKPDDQKNILSSIILNIF